MAFAIVVAIGVMGAHAQEAGPSVAEGERISRIGGCHDCHSAGFNESAGTIDPATALKGGGVGFRGPWGTTFASNLRIVAAGHTEDGFVDYMVRLEARPPMPWFNLRYFEESELRSLHMYIVSLGEPGEPAPAYVPPDMEPEYPYIVFAPPTLPQVTHTGGG